MGQETGRHNGSEGEKEKDEGWLEEAVGSLSGDDKERTEEQIDGAADRIEQAASSAKAGRAKEASSALSRGRRRDKFAGTVDKTRGDQRNLQFPDRQQGKEGRRTRRPTEGRGQNEEGTRQGPPQVSLTRSETPLDPL